MIRSAILGVEPTCNLVPYRYSSEDRGDLVDVLSPRGARRASGALDFSCRQYARATAHLHLRLRPTAKVLDARG
ncbi:MAG TPA: hypothetical protein VEP50_08370 [bacterium]|nr:hypothetical protein [bacterium]